MNGRPLHPRSIAAIIMAVFLLHTAGCMSRRPASAEPYRRQHPPDVAGALDTSRDVDHRPYEFIWDPRSAPRVPLIDFDRLIDWTVDVSEGHEASFDRSRDEQIWGVYTARLRYLSTAAGGSIHVWPPRPIPVRSRFDCVDLWVFGVGEACGPLAPERGPVLSLLMRDADGASFTLRLGPLTWGGWELVHKRLTEEELASIRQPCHFEGFLFEDLPVEEEGAVYLDSLSLYVEPLAPLKLDPRPARNVDVWPGISPGLHRGEERLPFPIDEDTIIPAGPVEDGQPRIVETDLHTYDFVVGGNERPLRYRLDLDEDGRGLSIYWDGVRVGSLYQGGGITDLEPARGRLVLARVEQGRLRAEFERGAVYAFGLQGRSLVVDAYSRRGEADGFSLGRYEGPLRYTALEIPGMGAGSGACAEVGVLTGGADLGLPPLFVSAALDGYRSEASALVSGSDDGAGSSVRTVYLPLTSGERNDVYERAVFTVSPRIEDVLPRIPNPPGKRAGRLRKKIWVDSDGPRDYGLALQASRELAGYGIRDVVQGHHESCWQDRFESCTYRTRAAPGRGGDEGLQMFIDGQKDLGWWPGLPASGVEIHALSPFWSPDAVQRTPGNAWKRTRSGHYAVKAPVAVELRADVAKTVAAKFKPAFSYVKDAAVLPPWRMTDYDARVPGAGSFAQAFYSLGELLLAEGDVLDGPVIAEGGAECFYAGLADGYLAPRTAGLEGPYLPVFYLTRLNPLACGFGVGPFEPTADVADADRLVDALLAAQIAYGRAGRLAPATAGRELQCRSYFMMQELQSRYLLHAPLRIAYWDGETLVSTSEAVTGGALTSSQLYLQYSGDLEIWVNGSPNLDWNVRVGRTIWPLPPHGWVASGPGFLAASARVDGARLDYVKTADFVYYDGRGRRSPFRGWSSSGPIAVWFHPDAAPPMIEVLDIGGKGRFSYPLDGARLSGVEVFDLDRQTGGTALVEMDADQAHITGPSDPHLYRIVLSEAGP